MELDAALSAIDVAMPSIDELPPLTREEIGVEQRHDDNLLLVRSWLDHTITPTPQELEGQSAAICTYATMRENLFLRDNVLGLVEEPFSGFRVLVAHSLVDRVLELAHILGAHEGLKKLMCRLNRSFFGLPCGVTLRFSSLHALLAINFAHCVHNRVAPCTLFA